MKKSLVISMTLAIPAITLPSVLALKDKPTKKSESKEKPLYSYFKTEFDENEHINKLLDLAFKDEKAKQKYALRENTISSKKQEEVKYSLSYFPINKLSGDSGYSNIPQTLTDSKDVLMDTLTNNWYWYLKNINKSIYVFNPFNDLYAFNKDHEALYKEVKKEFPSLSLNHSSNVPVELVVKEPEQYKELKNYDVLKNKKIFWLVYNSQKAVRGLSYTNEKWKKTVIFPDFFHFSNSSSVSDILLQIDLIEKYFYESKIESIVEELKYQQELKENDPDHVIDKDAIYNRYNDLSETILFKKNSYNKFIHFALGKIKENDSKVVYRFTWRNMNE